MLPKRLFLCVIGLVGAAGLPCPGAAGPTGTAAAPGLTPPQPPRHLATALRPTALLVRDGVALIADERHFLQRVTINAAGATPAAESFWMPATYPPRLLDGGGGSIIIADQHGDFIKRITAERDPWAEDLASGQQVRTMARDATHLYWINLAAPHLRRVPLRPPNLGTSRRLPLPPPAIEAVASVPEELVDLAVDAGEIFLANATSRSLQRLRASSRPDTVATFATPPTTLHLTADAVFVGSRGGAVYRVDRRDGAVRELGRVRGDVTALSRAGCFLLVGSSAELVALEAARGIAVPLAADASVTAVAAAEQRAVYADYKSSGLYDLPLPRCPGPEARGSARPVPVLPPGPRPTPFADPIDTEPLSGKSSAAVHTVQIRFETAADELARQQVRSRVERVLAEAAFELWARASDAQVAALQKDGFAAAYRDGVDRVRCTDVRKNPDAARRPPPPPFSESGPSRAYLVQLNVPSHALPDLQNELAAREVTVLEAEGATLTVVASPSAIDRLARLRYVTWTGAYGVRERLLGLAMGIADLSEACTGDPDQPLRALAAWVRKEPQAKLQVTAVLFASSAAFASLVRRAGGHIESQDEQTVTLTIRRGALPAIAAHPDVRVLEPYSVPGLID